jgi:hypothetical protein
MSPPATEEIGAMGREIESRQGIGWQLKKMKTTTTGFLWFLFSAPENSL